MEMVAIHQLVARQVSIWLQGHFRATLCQVRSVSFSVWTSAEAPLQGRGIRCAASQITYAQLVAVAQGDQEAKRAWLAAPPRRDVEGRIGCLVVDAVVAMAAARQRWVRHGIDDLLFDRNGRC